MTHKLTCKFPSTAKQCEIEIGNGISNSQASFLSSLASSFVIISHEHIASLHSKPLTDSLSAAGLKFHLLYFPNGEHYKSRETKEQLEDQMFEKGLGRDTGVIALGGGVVTDVAGFVAATYCRGLPLVMVPTSLLGMVDASIGGKTGVNVPYGKNMLGCTYQPKKIVIDLNMLKTLPKMEFVNGMVEIIKHALIADRKLFEDLDQHSEKILGLDISHIEKMVTDSCRIKKEIVEEDEKENGKRRLLNFGHTIGHALEKLNQYAISHGEAVAIGILVESYLAVQLNYLDLNSFNKIKNILVKFGLPLKLPKKFSEQAIIDAMVLDKKSLGGKPRFVMLEEIGSALPCGSSYCMHVDELLIRTALKWMNDDLCSH